MQPALELGEPRRQLLRPHAMTARRGVQRLDARLDLPQPVGIELDARGVVAQLPHCLARLRLRRFEQRHHRLQFGVVLGERAQPIGHGPQLRQRCTVRFRERFERRLRSGQQARAMLQALVLGGHVFPFAFARREAPQMLEPLGDVGALFLQALPVAEGLRRLARERLGAGVRIEQLALRRRAQQRLVRVLAMQVEEPFAGFLELRERRRMAVDETARAAGAVERAAQHQASRIADEIALGEPGFHGFGHFELAGDLGTLGAFAHERGIGPAADEELDRVHEQRLAGARLAGEGGEARRQFERGVLDQHEVADFERAQHPYSGLPRTSLQPSFSRSVAK